MLVLSVKQDLHKLLVCGHTEVFTRGETKVECRGEKIWSPETAYEKAFYGRGLILERL